MPSTTPSSTATTPSTTPRKAPQCSKCKRPRAGHPRSGCPFVDSPSNEKGQASRVTEGNLTVALESMVIASPGPLGRDEETKAFIRSRRRSTQPAALARSESLLSLSASSNEIVARLMQPGMFDDTEGEDIGGKGKASRIVRWQDTIPPTPLASNIAMKSKTPARSPMPGTLIPPTPDSSFNSSNASTTKGEIISANLPEQNASSDLSSSSTSTRRGQPLSRTMSAVERDIFITRLSDEASATIYIVPKADVEAIIAQATTLKFISQLVMNDDENDPQALLILGRNEAAVQALLQKIEKENERPQLNKKGSPSKSHHGPSTLKTAAGAAVIGAVGTWAGLAFS